MYSYIQILKHTIIIRADILGKMNPYSKHKYKGLQNKGTFKISSIIVGSPHLDPTKTNLTVIFLS